MALRLMPYYATFYSYKGGVGRTLALVNVAVALAKRGKSVILWEADLEAPGLLEMPFFAGLREKAKGGVIDLLADTESDAGRALERYLLVHPKFEQARLRILPAGKPGGATRSGTTRCGGTIFLAASPRWGRTGLSRFGRGSIRSSRILFWWIRARGLPISAVFARCNCRMR